VQRFLDDERIVERGYRNSLAQTALLLTCPGVPDLYQGTEVWDLSLVDPDNRRPVHYEHRRGLLERLRTDPHHVVDDWTAGGPKLALIHRVLEHRARHGGRPERYEPLPAQGPRADELAAFMRDELVVGVPCRTREGWSDTSITLPSGSWVHLVTGARYDGGTHAVGDLFRPFPVAVLAREGR
jgi:(1->4)-alpha-D-glucan 1-alpha-D-glucosylmutase